MTVRTLSSFPARLHNVRPIYLVIIHVIPVRENRALNVLSKSVIKDLCDHIGRLAVPARAALIQSLIDGISETDPKLFYTCSREVLRGLNRFKQEEDSHGRMMSVSSLYLRELVRLLSSSLTGSERDIVTDWVKSEKPVLLLQSKLSSSQQSELIHDLVLEDGFFRSRLPSVVLGSLTALAAGQEMYSSVSRWFYSEPVVSVIPRQVARRVCRPGGVSIGRPAAEPFEFKVYNFSWKDRISLFMKRMVMLG